jgi:hypothetical protein
VFSSSWQRVISGFAACVSFEGEQAAERKSGIAMIAISEKYFIINSKG